MPERTSRLVEVVVARDGDLGLDGASDGHANAVRGCYRDFRTLARTMARRCKATAAGA